MKKKYVILIIVGLFLVIGGYFGYKGFNLYVNVYSIEKSSDMKDYFKGLKIEDTITVKLNNQSDYEKLSIKGLSIKNENNNFILSSELTNTEDVKGFELKDDNSTKILMSKTLFDFYEAIGKDEEWIHKTMEEKNINNDLDLLLYAIKNKDNKPTIFNSIKEMKFYNYVYYLYIQTCSLKLEGIKLIDGDLKGYIVETKDMPIREINLIDGSNKYIISLWNKEYFTYDYIKGLLNTIIFIEEEKENNEECCKGCMCGDSIELLKNTETAWNSTKINSKGEYEYVKDAFINFHGTGKNRFAFFKNSNEIKGEFTINKENEIILIPDEDKNNKITCKLGEEKDLIAVLNCDDDFGTFTLQKQGTLELPGTIKDTISKAKIIKISYYNNKDIKTITEEKEINVLLSVINNSKVWTGAVTTPSPQYELELFDSNNNVIAKILYNPGHYFNIEINNKSYNLTNIDKNLLNTIL